MCLKTMYAGIFYLFITFYGFRSIHRNTWKDRIANNEVFSCTSLPNINSTFLQHLQKRGLLLDVSSQHRLYLPSTSTTTRDSLGRLFPTSGLPSFNIANIEVFSWVSPPNIKSTFLQHQQHRGLLLDVSSQHQVYLPWTSPTASHSLGRLLNRSTLPSFNISKNDVFCWMSLPNINSTFLQHHLRWVGHVSILHPTLLPRIILFGGLVSDKRLRGSGKRQVEDKPVTSQNWFCDLGNRFHESASLAYDHPGGVREFLVK